MVQAAPCPVFVYEYTCACPVEPGSLATEGWAMLAAVLEDFRCVPGVSPLTLLHSTSSHQPAGIQVHLTDSHQEEIVFRELVRRSTATLVIAPEFEGLLAERCRWVEEEGGVSLGSSSSAATLTGDKLLLSPHLAAQGIPTPVCLPLDADRGSLPFPLVLKPRDGAGSQATFLVRSEDELSAAVTQAGAEGWRGELIVQPFVWGTPASAAFLLGPGVEVPLPPAAQHLSSDGRFHYLGGIVPLDPDLARRASALALRAVRAVPGLRGYVGVDLVLAESGDQVIEINPRLTTSYVGLRVLTADNLADALWQVSRGTAVPLRWRAECVRFSADGRLLP
jgi:tyramine---L-glutamate ligase